MNKVPMPIIYLPYSNWLLTPDIEGMKYALTQIVSRHQVLRSTIEKGDNQQGIQIVHEEPLSIEQVNLTDNHDLEALINEDINHPFDLSVTYPIRVKFYSIQSEASETDHSLNRTILLVNTHHIASDGWSIDILQKELFAYYEAYLNNDATFSLPALEIQYKDYAVWQRSYLTGEVLEQQLSYWKDKLSGYQTLALPIDFARPNAVDYCGSYQEFTINKDISDQLRGLAKHYGVTLHSVLLSSINILLGKYTGQQDIVIGSPIANRHHRQTKDLIGFFVNTQVNRTLLSKAQSYTELIKQVHQQQIAAQVHQDLPFEKLVDELDVERDPSRHPVFQVMFVVQSFGNDSKTTNKQKEYLKPFQGSAAFKVEKFDLSIFIDNSRQELTGHISYATSLFHKDTIVRLINHYTQLLAQLTETPQKAYSELSLLRPEEYNQIIYQWNATDKEYEKDKTIYQLFQEQVEKTPDSAALVYEGQELSYRALNEKSNQLARRLRKEYEQRTGQRLGANTFVPLCLDRSLEMVIGILAVLKAGGAYVPIDPSYPQKRINYILKDTQTALVLTQKHLSENSDIVLSKDKVIHIDLTEKLYQKEDTSNLPPHSKAADLAYVIYTSGTTGKPKGVMVNHSGIVNRLEWMQSMYALNSEDVVLQKTPYVFDVSVWELIWANWYGAKIVLAKPEGHKDSEYLHQIIQKNKVTTLHFVPGMLKAYNHYLLGQHIKFNTSLRQIFCSGEALNEHVVQQTYQNSISQSIKLHNLYGPTEASIDVTFFETSPNKNIYIGRPIQNTQVYVLDQNKTPVPIGVIGELYIGGAGLARGYLNNKTLTAERFIPNPFATETDKAKGYTRLYKTGDLVRWLPDGNLQYIGRNDNQVKIRGYRIELAEIEHALLEVPGIKQCCVMAKERQTESGSTKYLVGYYVPDSDAETLSEDLIVEKLSSALPDYMVPGTLITMESFPLTINGKLDKRALPNPEFSPSEDYMAPTTDIEMAICNIWQQVLGLDKVGITDNFFRIGGNSILAIQVSHQMSKVLDCEVKVAEVFKYKTPSQLLAHSAGQTQINIPKTDTNPAVLSFAQERLWFIEQYEQGTNAYHIPALFELATDTVIEGMKYALTQIVSRHQVLRSTIQQGDNQQGIQIIHEEPLSIEQVSLTDNHDLEALIKEDINRPFDLRAAYPIRVKFYRIQSKDSETDHPLNRTILLVNTHHIASDGWSIDILQKELFAYYQAYLNNDAGFSLPALEIQYKDYAVWQRAYLTGEVLEQQLSYWKDKLSGYQTLALPTDYPRPNQVDYYGSYQGFTINKDISGQLRGLARRYGVTLHGVMLSAINILFGKYTGQQDIVIGSPIANRHHRQIESLIGFFVNTQVNRTLLSKAQSYQDLIKQVHQQQITAQLHQDLPFEKLVDELDVERDTSRHPVFQVSFVVQSFGNDSNTTSEQKEYLKPFQSSAAFEVEKFDLSIFIDDSQQELTGHISYATSLFHKDTIIRLIDHYTQLLDRLVKAPQKAYSELSLLRPEEYDQIIYQWNETDKEYEKDKTIYQLFQEQVEKAPDSTALVFEGQQLTYRTLNEKSNQLARHIRAQYQQRTKQELGADTLIPLCLDRSLEMVIAILAVLKAGAAYVPIDPSYPQQRLDYILSDTQAALVLSQRLLSESSDIQLPQDKVIHIDLTERLYKEEDTSNLPPHSKATDLAYVIYTSGTTGKPKGVMVEHHQISSFAIDNSFIDYKKVSMVASVSNYAFDGSIFDIFFSLINGKKLVLIDKDHLLDLSLLDKQFIKNNVDTVFITTALFNSLVSNQSKCLDILKQILFGGEACNIETVNNFKNRYKKTSLIHVYGPTENIVYSSYCNLTGYNTKNAVPIGTHLSDKKLYVLDNNLSPVPIGVIGELYIGGAGLARGYLNNKTLTEERFIPNPFATETDKAKGYTRLYKTGDLVRWLPDGNLEYIRRNDDQVKIRGYRIELAEIEHALLEVPGIKQTCVLAKERETETGSTKYLVGYYVPDSNTETLSEDTILDKLSAVLPEYMIPSALVAMESFPLTINGKLDKRALPDPDFSASDEYLAPTTELEITLSHIYAEVLGLPSDQISTHQNFFRMGGNSILSIQLKNKISQLSEFSHISIAGLFKYNSINKLVQSVQQDNQTVYKLQNNVAPGNNHEIAIIGLSGAFSGVNNIAELWQLIANQNEGIQFYTKDECKQLQIKDALLENPDYVPVAGKVNGIELFDPLFWEISPNEAKQLDPQIRKFIEHCWFALEAAGYVNQRKKHNIGVFAGSGDSNYLYEHVLNGETTENINPWEASVSNSKDALATKTAFFLGLSGPANSINTACSTGLVSVVEACYKLQLGVCDMALAGGVSLTLPDQPGYVFQEGMINSKDGHCRTFDHQASGTTGGSGVGVVLLKRLDDARKDQDNILAVIKGYATNNDGDRKTGYTAPSVIGQSECIINAQIMAGVTPDQIDYVECHGTATHLGDPIEVQALREAFEYNRAIVNQSKHKTILGAIKANIGHTNAAAGTAGLIKVCAMMENNTIPGQVNFNVPNPELHLDQTNFEIIKQNRDWLPCPNKQRLAGVSSFGIGGTNAHVIIGDYIPLTQNQGKTEERGTSSIETQNNILQYIIPISAKSRQSLEHYKQALIDYLTDTSENNHALNIQHIAYTLQERREHFNYRNAYCAKNIEELINKLKQEASFGQTNTENNNKVVFMFPGQGAQYTHMAKALYDNELPFKNTIDQCITLANQHLDVNLYQVMYPNEETSQHDINQIQWSQISLFIIEYALAKYLEHLGVKADAYIGHSFGEFVAATLSGVFTLKDAIKIVITRGKLMQSMKPGRMLAINAKQETINTIVEEHNCEIAVVNSSEDVVASGNEKDINNLLAFLEEQNIPTVKINGSVAGHSKLMDRAVNKFESAFKNIKLNKPTKHFVSNLTGQIAKEEVTTPEYWGRQLRNTVQFAKGIDSLSKRYNHKISFIEVGTGKGLSYFVNKHKNTNNYKLIQSVQLLPSAKEIKEHPHQNIKCKEDIIAKLWSSDLIQKPNQTKLFKQPKLITNLPAYQFDYQKCWLEKNKESSTNKQLQLLPKEKWLSSPVWSAVSNLNNQLVNDQPIFKNALVFLREDQLNLLDFTLLALNIQLIVLDANESNIDIIETAKLIRLNPKNEHHFEKLPDFLKTRNIAFDTIIHISSLDNVVDINNALYYSFYSLFLIRQYLINYADLENLLILTNGLAQITNVDTIHPLNGTLVGAIRNINHEFLSTDARVMDIGYDQKNIISNIAQVWNNKTYQKSEELLAIRFGKLWIERFESINNSFIEKSTMQDGDIILITGGLGGVGLAIAEHISSKHKVKLILVSRKNIYDHKNKSDSIKHKIKIIEKIKANSAIVDVQCADISSIEQIHTLVNKVIKVHGKITGLIHTAGVAPLSIDKYKLQNIKNALNGKVYGIYNIINTLDVTHLKFIASTSSLASITGDVNRFEYCAANSYLDYLAADKLRFKNTKILSTNWNAWQNNTIGRSLLYNQNENINPTKNLDKLMFSNGASHKENAELFCRLINQSSYEQIAISRLDINKLIKELFKNNNPKAIKRQTAVLENNLSQTEYQIAQIFGDILGVEQISIHDDFFKIGGNSILAIQSISSNE